MLSTATGEQLHEWAPFTAYAIEGDVAVGWYDTGRRTGGISSPRVTELEGRSLRGQEFDGYPVQRFLHCGYDGDSILVCSGGGGEFLATWDLDRRERLWTVGEIRDDRVLSARYSTIYHGALYLTSAGDGRPPLVLDARTGADLAAGIPEEMHEIGRGYGIHVALHSSGRPVLPGNGDRYTLEAYRSTG